MALGEDRPQIAIVMPTFNRAHILRRAVISVLEQTFPAWELVIVDDGSTDGTMIALAEFSDSRIRIVVSERQGAAEARNIGARISVAPFLTFLDSDDEVVSDWLEQLVRAFVEHGADIVTTGLTVVEPDGTSVDVGLDDTGPVFDHLRANITHSGTWAVRREIFFDVGGFTPGMPASQHTEVAFRLLPAAAANGWRICGIESPLLRYHAASTDGIRGDDGAVLAAAEFLIAEYGDRMGEKDPARLARSHAVAMFRSARLGDRARCRHHAFASLRHGEVTTKAVGRLIAAAIWPLRPRSWRV